MSSVHSQSPRGETYAPDLSADSARLERYRESWEMLEEQTQAILGKFTLGGCLPAGSGARDTRMELYQESLQMLDEMAHHSQQQEIEAMGVFVHGMLLHELNKLERYRARLGLDA